MNDATPLVLLDRGDASLAMSEEAATRASWNEALALLLGCEPAVREGATRESGGAA